MSKKKTTKKKKATKSVKKEIQKQRNPVVEIACARNSAGPMKSRNQKRKNRKSWRKNLDKMIDGEA